MDADRDLAIRELLRDLGWLPTDLACEEKRRLAEAYAEATTQWLSAGRDLKVKILERLRQANNFLHQGALYKAEYEGLAPAIDKARSKAAEAKLALEAHIAVHHC